MSVGALKIIFVILLCIPVAILAVFLLNRLMDELIRMNRERKEQKERERRAREQQERRRRRWY